MPLAPQEIRTYFITTVTAQRRCLFHVEQNALLLLDVLQTQRTKNTMQLHAFVLMPDHAHLLLTPAPTVSLEKVMQLIKGGFSFRLRSKLDVWERSYDSRRIDTLANFHTRRNYIHQNPLRLHLTTTPEAFPYSSAGKAHLTDQIPAHFRNDPKASDSV